MLDLRYVGWQLHAPRLLQKYGLQTISSQTVNPLVELLNQLLHVHEGSGEQPLEELPLVAVILDEAVIIDEEPAAIQICAYLLNGSLHLLLVNCWFFFVFQQGEVESPELCALGNVFQGIHVGFCQVFSLQGKVLCPVHKAVRVSLEEYLEVG